MTILIERFGTRKLGKNSNMYEWQIIDRQTMRPLCAFFSSEDYTDKDLKELAEKVAVHIDELVSTGVVSL